MAEKKRYFWLKLQNDFFGSKRIKKLRKLGSDYVIIYLKMQLLSLKDDGVLEFTGLENNFAEELALDIDEDVDKVQLTLSYLQSCGLMECSDDIFILPYVQENTGSETAAAQRVRDHRARKKVLHCNTSVTSVKRICNVEKEIEKEKELELEKELEVNKLPSKPAIDYQKIVNAFNTTCISYPQVKALSENRKKAIKARLNTYSEADILMAFEKAEESDFLRGKNNRNWMASFDWLMKDGNMAKVLEGNYDNKSESAGYGAGFYEGLEGY